MYLNIIILFILLYWCPNQGYTMKDDDPILNSTIDHSRPLLILFIDFRDFDCHLCFENFMEFVDLIDKYYTSGKFQNIIALVLNNYKNLNIASKVIRGWATANSIKFPVIVVSDNLFNNYNVKKTSAVILDSNKKIVQYEEFPLSNNKILEILNKILN